MCKDKEIYYDSIVRVKMVYIYVFELEDGRYYIGKSETPEIRIEAHISGEGSQFTRLHKPVKIKEIISDCDDYDEDKYTLKYMDMYGIHNVRGGTFSQIELTEENVKMINRMINGAKNQCFICGSKEHFVKNCDKRKEVKVAFVDGKCKCASSLISPHRKSKCAFKKVFDFFEIFTNTVEDEEDEIPFYDDDDHSEKKTCSRKSSTQPKSKKSRACYRCGREGHYASSCYAKKSIRGKTIYH